MVDFLIALDQLFNTLLGGYPDETLSSRAYRESKFSRKWAFFRKFVDLLFFWQKDHCYNAYQTELSRRHFHATMRNLRG